MLETRQGIGVFVTSAESLRQVDIAGELAPAALARRSSTRHRRSSTWPRPAPPPPARAGVSSRRARRGVAGQAAAGGAQEANPAPVAGQRRGVAHARPHPDLPGPWVTRDRRSVPQSHDLDTSWCEYIEVAPVRTDINARRLVYLLETTLLPKDPGVRLPQAP